MLVQRRDLDFQRRISMPLVVCVQWYKVRGVCSFCWSVLLTITVDSEWILKNNISIKNLLKCTYTNIVSNLLFKWCWFDLYIEYGHHVIVQKCPEMIRLQCHPSFTLHLKINILYIWLRVVYLMKIIPQKH
jgi:hypothetical protein